MIRISEKFKKRNIMVLSAAVLFFTLSAILIVDKIYCAEVKLDWGANSEPDIAGYKVYYGSSSRQYTSSIDVGNQTTCTVPGLEDGKPYYFSVTAYDSTGNESDYSNEVATGDATPAPAPSADTSSGGGGGGCFIATAAYGSYLAPEVVTLREFRDKWLMTSPAGKSLVNTYYRISPPIADFISEHGFVRTLTRWYLTPFVYAIKYPKALIVIAVTAFYLLILYVRFTGLCRRRISS